MKVSIITIVYNRRETIAEAIESVLEQTYPNIEYIIVDGNSTDGTVDIIKSYNGKIAKFISEGDQGLYFAINKGIKLATGEVIGFLHSDDLFQSNNVIALIVEAFKKHNSDSVYADLSYVNKNKTDKIIRSWVSGHFNRENFLQGWMPPHPTFYVRKSCYDRYGLYDTNFTSAADYELMLRFLYKHCISTCYIPIKLIKMRVGGKSNLSLQNRIKANQEDYRAWVINDLKPKFYTRYFKPLRKLKQFF